MTNVSKQQLQPDQRKKLLKQFSSLFILAGDRKINTLFTELFTDAEQIMFIKRIGIISLLLEERSNYEIARLLKVSEATVRATKDKYKAGKYQNIVLVMKGKNFDSKKFWSVLNTIVSGGLPPRGRGRWKHVLS